MNPRSASLMDKIMGAAQIPPWTALGPLLGKGSFASVYSAIDRSRRRVAALKLLQPQYRNNQVIRSKFENEGLVGLMLDHPGIAKTYAMSMLDRGYESVAPVGTWTILLECVEGQDLEKYTSRDDYSIEEFILVCRQVTAAMAHAHHLGIVHRDLKLENIMLIIGARPAVKIIDWGMAKLMPAGLSVNGLPPRPPSPAIVQGTPGYMSPEQMSPALYAVDYSTDVYALGAMMHETLVGGLPVAGQRVDLRYSDDLSDLIEDMLHPISTQRPSMPEVNRRLKMVRMHMPKDEDYYAPPPPPPSARTLASRFERPNQSRGNPYYQERATHYEPAHLYGPASAQKQRKPLRRVVSKEYLDPGERVAVDRGSHSKSRRAYRRHG